MRDPTSKGDAVADKLIHWFDIPALDIERAGTLYSTVLGVELHSRR